MEIIKINDYQSYCNHRDSNQEKYQQIIKFELSIKKQLQGNSKCYIDGYSWPIQSKSKFLVDMLYANNGEINFRERLVCKKTKLNNRIRSSLHVFEEHFKASKDDEVYLTEQRTQLAKWMKRKYNKIKFSEYLTNYSLLQKIKMGIYVFPSIPKHQDLTALSYEDNCFNFILSFDCFEHVPNYKKAFQECLRVLKPNGKIIWSVPFDRNQQDTLVRASFNEDGEIIHHTEPEYHGDPLSNKGCLSFYTFGWRLLDELKSMGYTKTYALLFWSEKYCYLGGEQILLCAEK